MITDKLHIQSLAGICYSQGVRHAIISPGSRNAPLILAFTAYKDIKCLSISDERSAAFFGLGIAQQTRNPVALICTSGSALLSYAPAVAEAYYQKIPLIVLSADRPPEWIDQGDGQTIRQSGALANFVRFQGQLPCEPAGRDEWWYSDRLVNEAMNHATYPHGGPVHLNVPLREPLYGQMQAPAPKPKEMAITSVETLRNRHTAAENMQFGKGQKIMIIAGQMIPGEAAHEAPGLRDNQVVVLTETTSNLPGKSFISTIDRVIETFSEEEKQTMVPDMLITIGGAVVSKKVKAWLRKYQPGQHWHISPSGETLDTYQSLTGVVPLDLSSFLQSMKGVEGDKEYFNAWQDRMEQVRKQHARYLQKAEWSDLKAFEQILEAIPGGSNIHLANSTPVRYAQLFEYEKPFRFDSNRGTSGIDGSVSTAAGAAYISGTPTTLITGDVGFFYDSNGLWHDYLSPHLKIIVINNGGGGIFRIIDGPDTTDILEPFLETRQQLSCQGIAETFGLVYYRAEGTSALSKGLEELYASEGVALLEVITPKALNARVLKEYFSALAAIEG